MFTKADYVENAGEIRDVENAGEFRDALYEALYRADWNRLVEEVIPSMSRTLLNTYDRLTVEDWTDNIYNAPKPNSPCTISQYLKTQTPEPRPHIP